MRQYNQKKYSIWITISILILFFVNILFSLNVFAQDDQLLFIVIHDSETNLPIEEDIFLEDKKYDIAVGSIGEYGYEYNVTVSVIWEDPFLTSEELPWITIEAPEYENYPEFIITAMKDGYVTAEQKITVLKGELYLTTDRGTVKEKQSFTVTVMDQNNNKMEGVTVFLDSDGFQDASDETDSNGIAYLTAPDVQDDDVIKINGFKEGYYPGSTTIRAENDGGGLFIGGLTPIIAAFIVLIFSIVFVTVKNEIPFLTYKSNSISHTKKIDKKKEDITKKNSQKREDIPIQSEEKVQKQEKEPWVEEIHISRPGKRKNSKYVLEDAKKITLKQKNNENEWFKGKDNVKFKIDKLTRETDEENEDKWFEGVYDIKSKVNKKVKKNSKQKSK